MNVSINPPGPQLYVDISSLAAQIASANSIEDVHICGSCKHNFSDIELFVEHKRSGCSTSSQKALPAGVHPSQTPVSLGYVAGNAPGSNEDSITSLGPQYLRVIFDGANLNIDDQTVDQQLSGALPCSCSPENDILRNRLLGLVKQGNNEANHNFQSSGELHSLVLEDNQQPNTKQRAFQIDEEDVATLLANQLASEVVNTGDESSVVSKTGLLDIPSDIGENSQDNFGLQSVNLNIGSNETVPKNNSSKRLLEKKKGISKSQLLGGEAQKNSKWINGNKTNNNKNNVSITCTSVPVESSIATTSSNGDSPLDLREITVVLPDAPSGKRRHKCSQESCDFTSLYMKDLIRHMRKHTGERPFQCYSCQRSFSRLDKLHVHERIHTGEKKYSCTLCDYATRDSGSLRKHMRVHNDERPYKCQMCSYRSRDSSQLTVHLRTHTGDNPFVCPYDDCSSAFKTSSDLKRHSRTHTGEKPFACSLCDYRCAIKSNLHIHTRHNHSENKTFSCHSCKFVCNTKREIKEHEKSHAEILKCGLCSYTCVSTASMKSHHKIHRQDKPFSCKLCSFTCQAPVNLKMHMKKKHPEARKRMKGSSKDTSNDSKNQSGCTGNKSSAPLKPFCVKNYKCTFCDIAFVREDSWRSHIRQHKNSNKSLGASTTSTSLPTTEEITKEPNEDTMMETMMVEVRSQPQEETDPLCTEYLELNYNGSSLKEDDVLSERIDKGVNDSIIATPEMDTAYVQYAVGDKDGKSEIQLVHQISPEVLERDNVSNQPILLYVQNAPVLHGGLDGSIRNAEILTSINPPHPILVGRCGQYLSVPLDQGGPLVEQFTSSLPQGMQYIVSAPFEGIVGGNTFLQPLDSSETSGNPVSVVSFQVDKGSSVPICENRN